MKLVVPRLRRRRVGNGRVHCLHCLHLQLLLCPQLAFEHGQWSVLYAFLEKSTFYQSGFSLKYVSQ